MSATDPYRKPIIRRDRVFEFLIPQYVDDLEFLRQYRRITVPHWP